MYSVFVSFQVPHSMTIVIRTLMTDSYLSSNSIRGYATDFKAMKEYTLHKAD